MLADVIVTVGLEGRDTHMVHGQIVTDTVLPPFCITLALFGVLAEPLVDILQCHGLVGGAHERFVDKLRIGQLGFVVAGENRGSSRGAIKASRGRNWAGDATAGAYAIHVAVTKEIVRRIWVADKKVIAGLGGGGGAQHGGV